MTAMGAFAYMLECADRSYYIGCATGEDLSTRVEEHNQGKYRGYTFARRPVTLVWSQYFDRVTDANAAERQIKGWSRAKKEALIKSDWTTVSALARRRGGRARNKGQK
jgi:putative endonuclease